MRDLFAKAKYPERVNVGICWQFDAVADADCFEHPSQYPNQVKTTECPAEQTKGCCWARAEALSLRTDEEYILQIDAHMRFTEAWDEKMIAALARCPSKKSVLSALVPGYRPPHDLTDCTGIIPLMHVHALWESDGYQPVSLRGGLHRKEDTDGRPMLTPVLVANFTFAPAAAFDEVPFDPHIFFRGEEPAHSARLWTHGWDIYQPDEVLIYHYWASQGRDKGGAHYKAHKDAQATNRRPQLGLQRVLHVLGVKEASDPEALVDIEKYSIGKVRTLKEYWEFTGVDLINNTISEKAKTGRWTATAYSKTT